MNLVDLPDVATIEEAAGVLRIGRTAAYDAARRGDLPVIRIGRTLRVPRHALERMLGLQNGDEPLGGRLVRESDLGDLHGDST
jgi:excisionase family DNA binding protein